MTKDLNKEISKIEYNLLNLPTKLSFEDGSIISYSYDANGNKLSANYNLSLMNVVKGTSNNTQGGNGVSTHRDYCGNFIYEDGALKMMLFDGGYVTFDNDNTPQYHFYPKDHLGNNRVVADANGYIEQVSHYYPFGGLMAESIGDVQPYKYNGKELDRMHGLDSYYYRARWMSDGRFTTQDPHATDYVEESPYAYCKNNPIRIIDPTGKDGMIEGEGSLEFPYLITAIYLYQSNSLEKDEIEALNNTLASYNSLGGSKGIQIKDASGNKVYVKYNLSSKEVENVNEARSHTSFTTSTGETRYYGNVIGKQPNESGNEYGSANNIRIDLNSDNISSGTIAGMNKSLLLEGVFAHEIGHNLGGEHADGTKTMAPVETTITTDLSGTSTRFTYPGVSKKFTQIIFNRHDKQKNNPYDGRLWFKE